jgi:hypothetical protein
MKMTIDFKTLTDGEIQDMFIEWVDNQPPEVGYDFHSYGKCAVGQFLKSHGINSADGLLLSSEIFRVFLVTHKDTPIYKAALDKPWTMGELAKRLEAVG